MADFELATLDATNINFNDMTLNAELTALDSAYDSVILSFDYGLNSDLSSATTSVTSGIFAVNDNNSKLIDGLTENTTYYFQAKGESVAYNSQSSMQNACSKQGYMNDLASNSSEMSTVAGIETAMAEIANSNTAMTEVANSDTAMTEVLNSNTAMTEINNNTTSMSVISSDYWGINTSKISEWLLSSHINDTMWNAEIGSNYFWDNAFTTLGSGSKEIYWADGSYQIRFDFEDETDAEITLDMTNVSSLEIDTQVINNSGGYFKISISINSTTLYEGYGSSTRQTRTFDMSGYSGDCTIYLTTITWNSGGTPKAYFGNINLIS